MMTVNLLSRCRHCGVIVEHLIMNQPWCPTCYLRVLTMPIQFRDAIWSRTE